MLKTFEIKLDVEKELYNPSTVLFSVSRNDFESIELQFEIIQDDAPFDLTGRTIELGIKKPSGNTVFQSVEIVSATEGKASARLSVQAYLEFGIHSAEVYVRNAESMVVTCPFYFMSRESIMETEDIESINDWSALQQALFLYDKKPILIDGVPTDVPEYAGQTALDVTNNNLFIATDTTADSWIQIGTEGGTTTVSWDTVLNKPLVFTPDAHTHEIADVNGLQTALDGKADVGETGGTTEPHTHAIADVTGLQSALDGKVDDAEMTGKADVNHAHDYASITGKPLTFPPDAHSHDFTTEITGKPATYPPEAHSHAIADVTNLQTNLDGKMDDGDAYLKTETYNKTEVYNKTEIDQKTMDSGGTVVEDNLTSTSTTNALSSNQGRILNETKADVNHTHDGFAPTVHNHEIADVNGLQTALDGKVDDTEMAGKSDVNHTHDYATDLTNVPTSFPPDVHTHDYETGITGKPTSFPPDAHTHAIADVVDLPATIDGLDKKPLIGTGAPSVVPEYQSQMYLDNASGEVYVANGLTTGDWVLISNQNGESSVAWGSITGNLSTQADLQGALDGKSNDGHSHTKADITDFAHSHTKADITDFAHSHDFTTEITGKPATYPPPLSDVNTVGGHRVGNGLAMVGEYLTVRSGTGLRTDDATSYGVEIDRAQTDAWYVQNASGMDLTLWKGTQAEYDAITPDANTLYFIVG